MDPLENETVAVRRQNGTAVVVLEGITLWIKSKFLFLVPVLCKFKTKSFVDKFGDDLIHITAVETINFYDNMRFPFRLFQDLNAHLSQE